MKRIFYKRTVFLLLLGFLLFFGCRVSAATDGISQENQEIMDQQMEISGANDLFEKLPDTAEEFLSDQGIDKADPNAFLGLSAGGVFGAVWEMVKQEVTLPFRIFATVVAIILLCSLFQTFRTTLEEKGYTGIFAMVSVLAVCGTVLSPITECIHRSAETIRQCSDFILAFIPVFSGIVAASGKPITATGYTTVMFGAVQAVSGIAAHFLVPLLGIFLAFCIIGSLNSQIRINGIVSTVKKVVIWTLGFSSTVLIGLLTVKGLVAGSADTVTTKTVKFMMGSFVPVVGGALSEALNSVQGCMGLIRSTVGSLGVIASALTFLPILITLLLFMGSLHLSAGIADLMSVEKVGDLLRACASVLSLIFGIILIFALMLIVSVTILLLIGVG